MQIYYVETDPLKHFHQFDQVVPNFNLSKLFVVAAIGPVGELSLGKWSMFHTYLLLLAQKQEDNYKECLPFLGKLMF